QDADPFVIRIGAPKTSTTAAIQVHDYVQANIWLQAAIYKENQKSQASAQHSIASSCRNCFTVKFFDEKALNMY
ncbi:MAG: hypothetical protein IKV71_05415, partial [Psychrobacter sp.]|nr:hypothetical protein [Psychrobacter sp.]